jgi:hypothetical protein
MPHPTLDRKTPQVAAVVMFYMSAALTVRNFPSFCFFDADYLVHKMVFVYVFTSRSFFRLIDST